MSKVQVLKDKGNEALSANNLEEAIKYYTEAIALDEKNAVLYSNRSYAYGKCLKFEEALKDAEKAIELRNDWAKGYARKGFALLSLKNYVEAVIAYSKGLTLDPGNEQMKEGLNTALSHLNLETPVNIKDGHEMSDVVMDMLKQQGKFKESGNGVQPSNDDKMDVDPPTTPPKQNPPKTMPSGNSNSTQEVEESLKEKALGNEAYKNKDFDTALKHYFKAVEICPNEITYYNNIAAVYFEQKEYKKCIEQCEKAIEIGRENRADFKLIAKAFTRIGNAYKKLNDLYNAKIYYEKSMAEHRTPEIRTLLSDVEKLIKEMERKAYIDPVKAEEEKEKGNELFKNGDYAEAVKHYTEAIKRNPDEPKYYSNRAACYTKLAAFDLGLKDCEMCLQLDPKFFKGWVRKGKILQGMQQHGKALVAYQKALDLDPANAEALEGYKNCSVALYSNPEEIRKRAMADPEIQAILHDPAMRLILEQMQNDPKALNDHLKNPDIAAKIQKLLESGLIVIR